MKIKFYFRKNKGRATYLLSCAGLFRARYLQLWQLVLSKKGVLGGYYSVR